MTDGISRIHDLLRPGLRVVFCGYNPSIRSGTTGRHYAFPGNRFWKVLYASGITPRLYVPDEDESLLELGIGFTNIVERPTRRADELTREEIRAGAEVLTVKIAHYRPEIMAYTGIGVYKWLRRTSKVDWGIQTDGVVEGVTDIVLPSPSGLNRMTFDQLVAYYTVVAEMLKQHGA